ncbi:Rieske (2Fe-2S) protein [Rhodococcus sp. CH91]|uniref:Rieske (2Fe-2S) protein n=1 Tax=Rhodococcus sp. CH91 TaxID=2910256 RepID=UPI001F4A66F9|nr:Rieske (2Fe-2S) protein [Rhodococcus sp. CH91]
MTVWTPVALARDIETGTASGTTVDGQSVALWRGTDDAVHAWADRCPHRGMRLSFGFVREDRLVCLYHGWQFDGAGACRHVPAHPRMEPPKTVTPHRYRAVESAGLVWVASTDAEGAPDVPDTAITPVRSVWIDGDRDTAFSLLGPDGIDAGAVVTGTLDGTDVIAGIQTIDAQTTAVHVVAAGVVPAATVNALVLRLHELRDSVSPTREVTTA